MKRKFLNWLYRKNETLFAEIMIESFYGQIPNNLKVPTMDFLLGSRNMLEKFFTIQAYNIQKRSIGDIKNTQYYAGILMHIKSILALIQRGRIIKEDVDIDKKEEDPINKVKDFIKGYEEKQKTKESKKDN